MDAAEQKTGGTRDTLCFPPPPKLLQFFRDMSAPPNEREVIDVDDLDIFCTGVFHCVRIDRTPSPRVRKRPRNPVTITLPDSDSDNPPQTPPQLKS